MRWIVSQLDRQWGGIRWEIDNSLRPHEANYLKLDSSKAANRLGWQPRWDLGTTLRSIVSWHQAHLAGADMHGVILEQIATFTSNQPKERDSR